MTMLGIGGVCMLVCGTTIDMTIVGNHVYNECIIYLTIKKLVFFLSRNIANTFVVF